MYTIWLGRQIGHTVTELHHGVGTPMTSLELTHQMLYDEITAERRAVAEALAAVKRGG